MKLERLAEGMQPQHCALSLVGEPIMYPEINTLVKLLHQKGISSFLVTNAQFPDAIRYVYKHVLVEIHTSLSLCHSVHDHVTGLAKPTAISHSMILSSARNLVPVTQLYVSVDASTKESLKRIDRPLFRDYWPRFISSLEALAEKVLATICN